MDSYWAIAWEDGGYGNNGGTGGGTYALCTGNVITNDYSAGIIIYAGRGTINYVLISGNTVSNCGGYGAISCDGSYCIIENNSLNS